MSAENVLDRPPQKTPEDEKTKPPRKWTVVFVNDDYTTFDFVIAVVSEVFRKTHEEASKFAMQVHTQGRANIGVYTREIAETKAAQCVMYAMKQDHPLQVTIEPVDPD